MAGINGIWHSLGVYSLFDLFDSPPFSDYGFYVYVYVLHPCWSLYFSSKKKQEQFLSRLGSSLVCCVIRFQALEASNLRVTFTSMYVLDIHNAEKVHTIMTMMKMKDGAMYVECF
jgi:hypothetical protein